MQDLKVDEMIVQAYGAMIFWVMMSTFEHKRARIGFFARVQYGKVMVIGNHSGTFVYNKSSCK